MFFSFLDEKSLLRIKKQIMSIPDTVYFETSQIIKLDRVKYRIRKSKWLRPWLESDFLPYIKGNEKKLSISFPSIYEDTMLVIPTKPYLNISDFAKRGSDREWLALFRRVKKLVRKGDHVSTHGHGVSWLHIRIEEDPKHYDTQEIVYSMRSKH